MDREYRDMRNLTKDESDESLIKFNIPLVLKNFGLYQILLMRLSKYIISNNRWISVWFILVI